MLARVCRNPFYNESEIGRAKKHSRPTVKIITLAPLIALSLFGDIATKEADDPAFWLHTFRLKSDAMGVNRYGITPMLTDDQIKAAIAKTEAELERTRDPARRKTLNARLRFLRHAELVNAAKKWDQDAN